ncbi:MAG: response regulator [Hyphomicrobiaceae bacterium]
MGSASSSSGGDFLAKRSGVSKLRHALPELRNILIVEDEAADADRLKATLHLMFGYDLVVRHASTLNIAIDLIIENKPELLFLDDILKPSDDAAQSIPLIKRAGYDGPIVVISGQVTRNRRTQLLEAGATEVIHKDDVDSVRVAECLARVYAEKSKS